MTTISQWRDEVIPVLLASGGTNYKVLVPAKVANFGDQVVGIHRRVIINAGLYPEYCNEWCSTEVNSGMFIHSHCETFNDCVQKTRETLTSTMRDKVNDAIFAATVKYKDLKVNFRIGYPSGCNLSNMVVEELTNGKTQSKNMRASGEQSDAGFYRLRGEGAPAPEQAKRPDEEEPYPVIENWSKSPFNR